MSELLLALIDHTLPDMTSVVEYCIHYTSLLWLHVHIHYLFMVTLALYVTLPLYGYTTSLCILLLHYLFMFTLPFI